MIRMFLCLALLLLLGGCSLIKLTGPAEPSPEQNQDQGQEQERDKAEASTGACRWQTTRGVAQLTEKLNGEALFEFFPGELQIKAPSHTDWHEGDEFKATLRYADQEGCGKTLDIMDSLESM